jgi:hypothetical protein
LVSHAGSALLAEVADKLGLTRALSVGLPQIVISPRRPIHVVELQGGHLAGAQPSGASISKIAWSRWPTVRRRSQLARSLATSRRAVAGRTR